MFNCYQNVLLKWYLFLVEMALSDGILKQLGGKEYYPPLVEGGWERERACRV